MSPTAAAGRLVREPVREPAIEQTSNVAGAN